MVTVTNSRRIFLGCMACYNEGCIFGEWLDLNDFRSLDDLSEKAKEICANSPCESGDEYDIQDHEGFHGLLSGMYPSLSEAWAIHETALHAEKEGFDAELVLEFASHELADEVCEEENCVVEKFQERYLGSFESLKDWAYEFVSETLLCELKGKVKEQVEYFFDYESYARDCEYSGDIWSFSHEGQTHVFTNNC